MGADTKNEVVTELFVIGNTFTFWHYVYYIRSE